MELLIKLEHPINGYWDGGAKKSFAYSIHGNPHKDSKGYFVKVGSFSANNWFNVACAKTVKGTLGNVRRKFATAFKNQGIKAQFSYVEGTSNYWEQTFFPGGRFPGNS